METLSEAEGFENCAGAGQYSERPSYRPITKFEKRGQVVRLSNLQDAALFNVNESITEEQNTADSCILRK